jgi:cytochrome c-type biogenesis protein CcmH
VIRAALVLALALALVLAAPAAASEQHPTLLDLEDEVMCPVCNTTLDQSSSPTARAIQRFISRRIKAGDTKSEIKRTLVANFGPAILAAPPRKGFDLLAWWLPFVGILAAAVVLGGLAVRWTRRRDPGSDAGGSGRPLDPELDRRVDEALARFEG